MSNSDIIRDFPKIDFLLADYTPLSSFCSQLITIKDDIFKINEIRGNDVGNLVYPLGQGEREHDGRIINEKLEKINYLMPIFNVKNIEHLNEKTKTKEKISTIDYTKIILDKLKITVKLYELNNEFYIEKKNMGPSGINKLYLKLTNTKLIGTGALSISLIVKTQYIYKLGDEFKIKNVCFKIYPLDIFREEPYASKLLKNKQSDLNIISKYITIREGLVGCWVNANLLNKKLFEYPITSTIMGVSDIFFANGSNINDKSDPSYKDDKTGLPFTYEQLLIENNNLRKIRKKYGKNWLNNNLETYDLWKKNIGNAQYGYVEMEPVEYTLNELCEKHLFSLDLYFECLYTKLCLQVIGNVSTPDDHLENIMTVLCPNVRKYIIKSRGKEYNFFINDMNKIKFIDLERTNILENRNIFVASTSFFRRGTQQFLLDYTQNPEEKKYIEIINHTFVTIFNFTIDKFCEFMFKLLPDKYTNEALYVDKKIETYYLDLDIDESKLIPDMLFQPRATDILRSPPYKKWSGRLEF